MLSSTLGTSLVTIPRRASSSTLAVTWSGCHRYVIDYEGNSSETCNNSIFFLFFFKACSNPLLYGWLNDNFRKEFQKIGASLKRRQEMTVVNNIAARNNKASTASTAVIRDTAVVVIGQQHHTAVIPHNSPVPPEEPL